MADTEKVDLNSLVKVREALYRLIIRYVFPGCKMTSLLTRPKIPRNKQRYVFPELTLVDIF